ncbi:MAG: transposase [Burkholderiaceae bacterium]|uniref:transposase n=1 Tax=Extensimonas perlucida TaxID=2590786 RepID=UPI0011A68639
MHRPEFREAAIKQVIEAGRSIVAVARSLEMPGKSLANRAQRARHGQPPRHHPASS